MNTWARLTIRAIGLVIFNNSMVGLEAQAQFNYAVNGGAITITRYPGIDDAVNGSVITIDTSPFPFAFAPGNWTGKSRFAS